jgi:C4-dicarboxylate transporter
MTEVSKKLLYWAPRGLCLAFALFLCLLVAAEVFTQGLGFWRTLLALFMHLIPVFGLLLILALAWRWE